MKCCLCGRSMEGHGNSSQPLVPRFFDDIQFFSFFGLYGRCCDVCDREKVLPARLAGTEECLLVSTGEGWQCTSCGTTIEKEQRPEKCPSCNHVVVHYLDGKTHKPMTS